MSQPKRYRPALDDGSREPWMKESELGGYVEYADYAALENHAEALEMIIKAYRQGEDAIQAENERLRKAGDAMDAYLKRLDGTTNGMLDCRRAWLAAKGGQS